MADDVPKLKKLRRLIEDGKNVMVFGPDNVESQQVVTTYIQQLQDRNQKVAVVNICAEWKALDFTNSMSLSIFKELEKEVMDRPTNLTFQSIIEDTLYWADCQCEGKQMVVVFLEFHHVHGMPGGRVDAFLRSVMQRLSNISFVFMSSQKEALSRMFILKSQPMYGMASTVDLPHFQ